MRQGETRIGDYVWTVYRGEVSGDRQEVTLRTDGGRMYVEVPPETGDHAINRKTLQVLSRVVVRPSGDEVTFRPRPGDSLSWTTAKDNGVVSYDGELRWATHEELLALLEAPEDD